MILDFILEPTNSIAELRGALACVRAFKAAHTMEEDFACMFAGWTKLEQLQEFLEHLVEGAPLKEDTLRYMELKRNNP